MPAFALIGSVLAGCTAAQPAAPAGVVAAQQEAWNAGDLDAFLARGYWNSPELAFLSGGSWTTGYRTVLERYRRRYVEGDAEMGRLTFSRLETVELGPDHALVRGRWELDFDTQDDAGGLFSLVFRRLPEGWRVIHDHTSSDGD